MKRLFAILALLTLGACGGGSEGDPYLTAFQQLRGGLFNRSAEGPAQFTATRAVLIEAGITRPVLVARLPQQGISVGLVEFRTRANVTIWQSLDGNTLTTAGGVLRNSRGFGVDLHSLETAPVERALALGEAADYARLFRAIDGEGALQSVRLYCRIAPQGAERVDVLGRGYDTVRFRETCTVADRAEPVFENDYWRGRDGAIWRSRQWAGPELGYADLERVVN